MMANLADGERKEGEKELAVTSFQSELYSARNAHLAIWTCPQPRSTRSSVPQEWDPSHGSSSLAPMPAWRTGNCSISGEWRALDSLVSVLASLKQLRCKRFSQLLGALN